MDVPTIEEPSAAFGCLQELQIKNRSQADQKQAVYFKSIAQVADAFLAPTSFFKRLYLRLFKSEKTEIIVGRTKIPVFSYNRGSNVFALRKLFAFALDSPSVRDSTQNSEKVLNFVFALEKRAGRADQKVNCFSILKDHFLKQLKNVSNLKELTKLCGSPEGKVFFSKNTSEGLSSLLEEVTQSTFLSSAEAVGTIFENMGDRQGEFENMVWQFLEGQYASGENPKLGEYISCLRRHGMQFHKLAQGVEVLIEQQKRKLNRQKETLLQEVNKATQDTFGKTLVRCNTTLQEALRKDQLDLALKIPPERDFVCMQKNAFQGQLHIIAEFTTKSISRFISIIEPEKLSPGQKTEALSWMKSLLTEFEALAKSPHGAKDTSLAGVIAQIKRAIKEISPASKIEEVSGKSELLSKLAATAERVAKVSKLVFKSLPFVLTFLAPVAFATISGAQKGGLSGAVISGAIAAASSVAAGLGSSVAGWAAGKVAAASFFPDIMKDAVKTTFSFVFQLGLIYTAMQANCIVAGSLVGIRRPLEIQAVPVKIEEGWFSSLLPVALKNWFTRVWEGGSALEEATVTTGKALGSLGVEEAFLFHAFWSAPEKGWPVLSRITNIFSRQISAGAAGFEFGLGITRSLKAAGHFIRVLFTFS